MSHFYSVVKPVRYSSGQILHLSDEAAARRRGMIKNIKNDLYQLLVDLDFKAGEIIGFAEPLPSGLVQNFIPLDDAESDDGGTGPADDKPPESVSAAKTKSKKAKA